MPAVLTPNLTPNLRSSPEDGKLPNIFWHASAKQWCCKIGYWLLPSKGEVTSPGRRDRAYQYVGKNQNAIGKHEAETKAIQLKAEWSRLVVDWPAKREDLEKIAPDHDWSKPVWTNHNFVLSLCKKAVEKAKEQNSEVEAGKQLLREYDQEDVQKIAARNPDLLPSASQLSPAPSPLPPKQSLALTIEQARVAFLEHRKGRTELKRGRSIKANSYNYDDNTLECAMKPLAPASIKDRNDGIDEAELARLSALKPIDTTLSLSNLTRKDLENFVNYWWSSWNGLSPRTAKNYCMAVYNMLKWAADQDQLDFNMPKGSDRLFRFSNVNPINIERYDAAKLMKLREHSTPKCYLYQLLGMNFGAYQGDISHLRLDEIVKLVNGEPIPLTYEELKTYTGNGDIYVFRLRDRTEHKIDPRNKALHWLFPEAGKLLAKHLAPKDNAFGYCLLNDEGNPLRATAIGRSKICNVTSSLYRACKNAEISFAFKQFRKIGSTSIASLATTDSDAVVRLYRSQPPAGDARFYVADDYEKKLTPVLKEWAEKLRVDKVLVDTHQPPRRRGKNKKTSAKESTLFPCVDNGVQNSPIAVVRLVKRYK